MRVKVMEAMIAVLLSFIFLVGMESSASSSEGLPDLAVEISGPAKAKAGEDIGRDIKLVVKNLGNAAAPGSRNKQSNSYMFDSVLSTDEVVPKDFATYSPNYFEDVLLRGGRGSNLTDLAPGESKIVLNGAGIPSDTPAGNYFICAQIDPGAKVAESDEENNVSCMPIEIER